MLLGIIGIVLTLVFVILMVRCIVVQVVNFKNQPIKISPVAYKIWLLRAVVFIASFYSINFMQVNFIEGASALFDVPALMAMDICNYYYSHFLYPFLALLLVDSLVLWVVFQNKGLALLFIVALLLFACVLRLDMQGDSISSFGFFSKQCVL